MGKGLETKQKLILAAIDLFAKKGIQWVSFNEIGAQVGIAQPTLYKYFADKDDLILSCLQHVVVSGRQMIDQNVDPYSGAAEQIRAYCEGNLMWVEKRPQDAVILFAAYYFAYNNQPLREMLLNINGQSVTRLGLHLAAGEREGAWKLKDRHQMARIIHSLLVAEMFKAIHEPKDMTLAERTQLVSLACERILSPS